ncbi:unnamed protein product [Discosporangium mesarthrocarpum]
MATVLGMNHHGKGRVRLLKVVRRGSVHSVVQFTVEILLDGPMETAFTKGDNSIIIPTDTQKNTVYVVAKNHAFECAEDFALILTRHFLKTYPQLVSRCRVCVQEVIWDRIISQDSAGKTRPHDHAFVKRGPYTLTARSEGVRNAAGFPVISLWGGVKELVLFKTTQSSFVDFHKDENTSLPEASDRLLGTCMDGEWVYDSGGVTSFKDLRALILDTLMKTFSGPADTGVPSPSLQLTCFQMGSAVLAAAPSVKSINLLMPNVHNLPFDLSKYGLINKDHTGLPDIFYPTDEPHGIIQATVERPVSRL